MYVYKAGIVHRDLKLENILLNNKTEPVIIDFGMSARFNKETILKSACGTPLYCAPEVITAADEV